jgi:D-inositol-3-phosphate glycosyltransferase
LSKEDLPSQLCTFAREVLRTEAMQVPGHYDAIHSHYWLSGQVGALARDRWGVPLVHSMHTMAKVKNLLLAAGDAVEPTTRLIGEEQVVAAADLLIANTNDEARQLTALYSARPEQVRVVHPGVDLSAFGPGDRGAARSRVGLPEDADVVLFVGRIQPLKAPDVVVRAAAELVARRPELRSRLVVAVVGGPSGSGLDSPTALADLADRLGVLDVLHLVAPQAREALADYYRAASLVCVPSYNESFGLVAIEAQASGVPVVAAKVGGLPTAVVDGMTGILVDGHEPRDYAHVFEVLLGDPDFAADLGAAGHRHAQEFTWDHTATSMVAAYRRAVGLHRAEMWSVAGR